MTELNFDQIEALLKKAQEKAETSLGSQLDVEKFATSDDVYEVVGSKRDPNNLTKVLAVNKMVKKSGVINHFVFDEKLPGFVCAGITFTDGSYIHLDPDIPVDQVLKTTD